MEKVKEAQHEERDSGGVGFSACLQKNFHYSVLPNLDAMPSSELD